MALFELRGITKRFGDTEVLRGLDLDIRRGEFLTICGESGCGKSLVLKSLIGLMQPDSGSIVFDGEELSKAREAEWVKVRQRIGMLFQESALFDSQTVLDNIAYGLREQRVLDEATIRERVRESLHLVSLPGIEDMWPGDLSGGMRKRVALARAVALRPEVVLYDEPTEGLDPINVTRVNRLLLSLREQLDITTVVVTHNMKSAFDTSDRLAFLHEGVVAITGSPAHFRELNDARFVDFERASKVDPFAR